MRDIKFRALFKHILTGKTVWNYIVVNYTLKNIKSYVQVSPWLQYTGLKDKEGQEIYEGDILKMFRRYIDPYPSDEPYEIMENLTGEVRVIASRGACIYNPFSENLIDSSNDIKKNGYINIVQYRTKLIGNKYDNPELLEQ